MLMGDLAVMAAEFVKIELAEEQATLSAIWKSGQECQDRARRISSKGP